MAGSKVVNNKKVEEKEEEEEEIYEVEKLLAHRRSSKNKNWVEYLIKWKDYSDEYNSWEKEHNIFSKGLVHQYWSTQPYTHAAFKNNTHEVIESTSSPSSPNSSSTSSPKKRPTPSSVMLEIEKRQKLNHIRAAQLTAEPPNGLKWTDIESITNVFHCGKSTYFAEVKWNKSDTVSFIPTRVIRGRNPLKLIHFYESQLDFSSADV